MNETPSPPPPPAPAHPPTSPPEVVSAGRSGKYLVVRRETSLPPRCVQCNAPVEGKPLKKDIAWHHPAIYLTILAGLLIYVILAIVLRKRVRLRFHLCDDHRSRRRKHIGAAWLLVLLCPALIYVAVVVDNGYLALGGLVCLFAGLVYTAIFVPIFSPKRITDQFGWLRGAHPDFLAELPEAPAPG